MSQLAVIDGTPTPEPFIGREQMAQILGIHVRTLDRMVAAGQVPSATWGRRTRKFQASEVLAHLRRAEMSTREGEAA